MKRQFHRGKTQENNFDSISERFPALDTRNIGQATEGAFESEIRSCLCQSIELSKE